MATQIETIAKAPDFRMGAYGPIIVTVYRGGANAASLRLLDQYQTEMLTRHPKLFTFAIVVGDTLTAPTAEVRQFSSKLQEKYGSRSTGAAVVITVSGLAAVVARGFMAALSLITPPVMNQKTFKTVRDAVAWARSIPDQVPEIAVPDLTEALEAFMKG